MLKRRIRVLTITGITIVAAALTTLSTTAASAATTTPVSSHAAAPQAADASGCVTETFTTSDEPYYEPCVADEQILLNDLWYYWQAHASHYLGADQLLTVDGSYGSDTKSDVVSFQQWWGLADDGETGPITWGTLCDVDYGYGYTGAYWHDAGCATEPGL